MLNVLLLSVKAHFKYNKEKFKGKKGRNTAKKIQLNKCKPCPNHTIEDRCLHHTLQHKDIEEKAKLHYFCFDSVSVCVSILP